MISASMRDVLIEHMDGRAVPIVLNYKTIGLDANGANVRSRTIRSLLQNKLIKNNHSHSPTHTLITDAGRAALCEVFGQMAEILVRAGLRVEELVELAKTSGRSLVNPPRKVAEPEDFQKA